MSLSVLSLSVLYSRASVGIDAPLVSVETHLSNGLPAFIIVGLPETAVRESKDRVRSAILNSGFEFPAKRITINLAPADLPKEGGRFDLAIAMGILVASGQLPGAEVENYEFLGELALTGELRGVTATISSAVGCRKARRQLVCPRQNEAELSLLSGDSIYLAASLAEICAHFSGLQKLPLLESTCFETKAGIRAETEADIAVPDLGDIRGQAQARRALEIAASGGHNMLLYGPPGAGKSMLASRLPGILPALSETEALEVASLYSLIGLPRSPEQLRQPPFRSPHHSASSVALVGGGSHPAPGEVSLSHAGVLFLDELPEFGRRVLEVLREPLESGEIHIARAAATLSFPARFQLVAAMNPCPCGYYGHPSIECRDTPQQIAAYQSRISGPLLDRIDMHVRINPVQESGVLMQKPDSLQMESSASVAERVKLARQQQLKRQGVINARLGVSEILKVCELDSCSEQLLETWMREQGVSLRAVHRTLRLARTIADLQGDVRVNQSAILEAMAYRISGFGRSNSGMKR